VYLSRIRLDSNRKETKLIVSSPQRVHAIVEGCFDEYREAERGRTIWRLDYLNGNLYLLIVSEFVPNFSNCAEQLCKHGETGQTKDYVSFLSYIKNGQELRFRFRGNPVHSVVSDYGKRGKVMPHVSEHHKKEWLIKKSDANGFAVDYDSFIIVETGQQRFYRSGEKNAVKLVFATYEGILSVTDRELFINALCKGIGRGKAYGCGLITVMKM